MAEQNEHFSLVDYGFGELEIGRVYGQWIVSIIRPFLGDRVLEIGCGVGSMVQQYIDTPTILATDVNPGYIQRVKKRFRGQKHVTTLCMDIIQVSPKQKRTILQHNINTVIAINVLEHIKHDRLALTNIRDLMPNGGKLILFVPAHQWLYGALDEAFGHFRRYSANELREKLQTAGYTIDALYYFNFIGIVWWYLIGKILRKNNLPSMTGNLLHIIVPMLRVAEKYLRPPIGQSLIVVAHVSAR